MKENNIKQSYRRPVLILLILAFIIGTSIIQGKDMEKEKVSAYMNANFLMSHFTNYSETSRDMFYGLNPTNLMIDRRIDAVYVSMIETAKNDITFTQSNDGVLTMKEVEIQISMVLEEYRDVFKSYEERRKEELVLISTKKKL